MTRATIATDIGDIEVDLYDQAAPKATKNFIDLANKGFYDDVIFHRVIPGFVIQGGDGQFGKKAALERSRVGTGGPGYKFEDETRADLRHDKPGVLSMANAGPRTNGSQFFITEIAPNWLNGKHTIFGQCKEVDLVKQISAVAKGPGDRPTTPVTINKITFSKG